MNSLDLSTEVPLILRYNGYTNKVNIIEKILVVLRLIKCTFTKDREAVFQSTQKL